MGDEFAMRPRRKEKRKEWKSEREGGMRVTNVGGGPGGREEGKVGSKGGVSLPGQQGGGA